MFGLGVGETVGIVVTVVGLIAWFVRLEQGQKNNTKAIADLTAACNKSIMDAATAHTLAVARVESDMRLYYATKNEITELKGQVNVVSQSSQRIEQTMNRLENKFDTVLVAAAREKVSG